MPFTLTCMLCLAGAAAPAAPAAGDAGDGATTSLVLASAPAAHPDLHFSDLGPASALAQHDHGSHEEGGEGDTQGRGEHGAWMGTTMIVVMVAMMVGVGAVMMARGSFMTARSSSPAAAAVPVTAPARFLAPGG
jgi:hypothetical protein